MLTAVLLIFTAVATEASPAGLHKLEIRSGDAVHRFQVEVMRTAEDRARGLMHRRELPLDHGMLFDFGGAVTAHMWMKNTYIPLDMLFIKGDGTITNIARDTVPHSTAVLSSDGHVRYVLEINAGLTGKLGISAGDKVVLPPGAE